MVFSGDNATDASKLHFRNLAPVEAGLPKPALHFARVGGRGSLPPTPPVSRGDRGGWWEVRGDRGAWWEARWGERWWWLGGELVVGEKSGGGRQGLNSLMTIQISFKNTIQPSFCVSR